MEENDTTPAAAVPKPKPRRVNHRALRALREPIPARSIGKKPRVYCWDCNWASEQKAGATCDRHAAVWCNTCRSTVSNAHDHDDYVGHAEVTDRFLDADLAWNWRPMAFDERGLPALDDDGGMWMYVSIGGVERPAYGKPGIGGKPELISNGLKNGGIRFGVALDQWAQTDLHPATKTCTGCAKTTTDAKARFCDGCGHELPAPKNCASCGRSDHDEAARFCSGCGHDLSAADGAPAEQWARPDWIARINSLLARKRGAHGPDRLSELSEILGRNVDDAAHLSPDEARQVVRILSGTPDLYPPAPAAEQPAAVVPEPPAAVPAPTAQPAQSSPAPQPPARPAAPAPRAKRGGPKPSPRPAAAAPVSGGISDAQVRTINSLLNSRGVLEGDAATRLGIINGALGRDVESLDKLSAADAEILIRGLGSGYFSADPPAAPASQTAAAQDTAPEPEPESEPDRSVFDGICAQISQAITEEDAGAIKVEIGKALTGGTITKADGAALSGRLEKRGRQVGLAGGS